MHLTTTSTFKNADVYVLLSGKAQVVSIFLLLLLSLLSFYLYSQTYFIFIIRLQLIKIVMDMGRKILKLFEWVEYLVHLIHLIQK